MARPKNKPEIKPIPLDINEKSEASGKPVEEAAKAVEKPHVEVKKDDRYVCVLNVRENSFKGAAGESYEGSGLKDKERLQYLLDRGAIRAV